jgi:hypothetical protein
MNLNKYEKLLVSLLNGINKGLYKLTEGEYNSNALEFKDKVQKDLGIAHDITDLLLAYLTQNNYIVITSKGIKFTPKLVKELREKFGVWDIEEI